MQDPISSDAALPCGHEHCQLCPARRDHPGFRYPDEHIVEAVLVSSPQSLRVYVDGAFTQEVLLHARTLKRARRDAGVLLSELRERTERDAQRHHLDLLAQERAQIGRSVARELDALGPRA